MAVQRLRQSFRFASLALAASVAGAVACTDKNEKTGELVVSVETDMAMPDGVDHIRMLVSVPGTTLLDRPYDLGTVSQEARIPATLALLAGNPSVPVTIQVRGERGSEVRTLREVVTTVPINRSALLRMPVQWLCDGLVKTVKVDGVETIQSQCGDTFTCVSGKCVPKEVDSTKLPDYRPQLVFGGADKPGPGTCFDTAGCMLAGQSFEPDSACTIAKPLGTANINVALRVANDGICDLSRTACFVPLNAESQELGWTSVGDRIQLPAAVCDRFKSGLVSGIVVSTACPSKTDDVPPCGKWSSVEPAADAAVVSDAGQAVPELVTKVLEGTTASLCCPLLSDGQRLLTCTCQAAGPAAGDAGVDASVAAGVNVVAIDRATGSASATLVGRIVPTHARDYYSGTVAIDGALLFTDRATDDAGLGQSTIDRASTNPAIPLTTRLARINGDIFDDSPLLTDPTSVYALADHVRSAEGVAVAGAPVQIVRVDRSTGAVVAVDTGSDRPVFQFAQDDKALYVLSVVDSTRGDAPDAGSDAGLEAGADAVSDATADSTDVVRNSRIRRIPKTPGELPSVLYERTVPSSGDVPTGFLGIQAGADAVYALLQEVGSEPGTYKTLVVKIDTVGTTTTLYERVVDPKRTSVRLLGVVDRSVLLARTDLEVGAAGVSIGTTSVVAVPMSAGPAKVLASYAKDTVISGVQTLLSDPDNVYWLNASGSLYRLNRSTLR